MLRSLLLFLFQIIFLVVVYLFCRKRADNYDFKHYENSQVLKKINREIKRLKDKENVDEIEKLQSKKRLHEELAIKLKKKEKNSMSLFYMVLFLWIVLQIIGGLYIYALIKDVIY